MKKKIAEGKVKVAGGCRSISQENRKKKSKKGLEREAAYKEVPKGVGDLIGRHISQAVQGFAPIIRLIAVKHFG